MWYARFGLTVAALAGAVAIAGCAGRQHLNEYTYAGKTIAVVYDTPPAPFIWSRYDLHTAPPNERDPMSARSQTLDVLAQIGQRRVDSASVLAEFPQELARRVAAEAATRLGATPSTDASAADYVLHVSAKRVGLSLYVPQTPALYADVESALRDARTGRVIWRSTVHEQEPLSDFLTRTGQRGALRVSGLPVDKIPVAEYEQMLQQLARFSAEKMTSGLRGGPKAPRSMATGSATHDPTVNAGQQE